MSKLNSLILFILILGCGTSKNTTKEENILQDNTQIDNPINQFGFDLYKQVSQPEENTFFSPISISSAMAMAYLGADGQTEKEFQNVLLFQKNTPEFHEAFRSNIEKVISKDSVNLLRVANSIWLQQDFKLNDDYINNLKTYYGGNFNSLDFIDPTNREQTRERINKWVEKETNNKIKNIIPKGTLTPQTRSVLVNAVYFLSEWNKPFEEKRNTQKDFFVRSNKSVETTFMNNSQSISYYEDEKMQCVDIPYKGGKFSLFIALSKNEDTDNWYDENFSFEYFQEIQNSFQNHEVDVSIPKFKMETSYKLIPYLQEMGIKEAFTDKANFSKMSSKNDLKITDILHKAFVEVNERGTKAAASTAVVMSLKSAYISEKKIFVADHPFMFMILEKETNTIIFMGEFNKP